MVDTKIVQKSKTGYRVVYGETMPMWEEIFPTLRKALACAKAHKTFGDIIFSVRRIVPGEKPQSMTALIEAGIIKTKKIGRSASQKRRARSAGPPI